MGLIPVAKRAAGSVYALCKELGVEKKLALAKLPEQKQVFAKIYVWIGGLFGNSDEQMHFALQIEFCQKDLLFCF